jgi:peptidoglycan/xylan/chitin deacetylase (PgdA/CDA1 family)
VKWLAVLAVAATAAAPAGVIDHGPRAHRVIALTFDADMTRPMLAQLRSGKVKSWYDRRIVAYLRATRTPATIFLTGLWTREYPAAVRSLARDPLFELENHSWDHAAWSARCFGLPSVRTRAQKVAEVRGAAAEIEHVTGRVPRYFRFPGGCYDRSDVGLVESLGERVIGWDDVSGDAFQPDPKPIVWQTLHYAQPGGIVVMHLMGAPNAPATYDVLKQVVPELRRRGYRFVTVRQLLEGRA